MLTFKNTSLIFVIFILALLSLNYLYSVSFWVYVVTAFFWLFIVTWGSFSIQSNFHFKSLLSKPTTQKNQIAITFDDGPNYEFTQKVLDLLKMYDAKATFFCIGKKIENHPELLKKIISQGHTIGNHTYSHSNWFGFYSTQKVISELKRTQELVKQIIGLNLKLFRPAFGVTNPNIKKAIKILQLQSVGWSIRSLDTTSISSEKVLKRITKDLKKGDVILLHDTSKKTIVVLEQLLLFLQEQNLKSVTIDTLFKISAYA